MKRPSCPGPASRDEETEAGGPHGFAPLCSALLVRVCARRKNWGPKSLPSTYPSSNSPSWPFPQAGEKEGKGHPRQGTGPGKVWCLSTAAQHSGWGVVRQGSRWPSSFPGAAATCCKVSPPSWKWGKKGQTGLWFKPLTTA